MIPKHCPMCSGLLIVHANHIYEVCEIAFNYHITVAFLSHITLCSSVRFQSL